MLKESFLKVLNEYQVATKEQMAGHSLAKLLRKDIPEYLQSFIDEPDRYRVEGSAGRGRWARCPWIAVIDVNITKTPESGYFIMYLFREDMSGIYLSLIQGVTEIRAMHEEHPREVLKNRAENYRKKISGVPKTFPETKINLGTKSTSELASFYEAGNIFAKYYSINTLESSTEKQLIDDFGAMMKLYKFLARKRAAPDLFESIENPIKTELTEVSGKKQSLIEKIKKFITNVIKH